MLIQALYGVSDDSDGIFVAEIETVESVLQTNLIEVVQNATVAGLSLSCRLFTVPVSWSGEKSVKV